MRKITKTNLFLVLALIILFSMMAVESYAQNKQGDSKREEIQRYFGYETLMYRYLSIPYDVSMNINVRGDFTNVGFLYLLLIPLLFMIKYRRKKWVAIGMPLLLILLFIMSSSNGFILEDKNSQLIGNLDGKHHYKYVDGEAFSTKVVKSMYNLNNTLYTPLKYIGNKISGNRDYITYPLVLLLFLGFSFLLYFQFRFQSKWYVFLVASLFWIFSFFWYILSSGIIWYGFLAFLLGLICMVLLLPSNEEDTKVASYTRIGFYSLFGLWICVGLISRMSNINPSTPIPLLGQTMLNNVFLNQMVGNINETQTVDYFYKDLSNVLKKVNLEDKSLVYRVGTSFTYFIRNNHNRVFLDNQLGFFRRLEKRIPSKIERSEILKAYGFKYLIIDLNTPSLDNTPEKSLVDKFNGLIDFVYKNPKVRLLTTNRQVKVIKDGEVTNQTAFDVFGKVEVYGSFAIYEIL